MYECMSPEHTTRGPRIEPDPPPLGIWNDASPCASPRGKVSPPYHIGAGRGERGESLSQRPQDAHQSRDISDT